MNLNIGSRPGILYGLPKVHKLNFSLRPIISSIGTHCYKVAKFFVPLLHPFSTNPLTITDTLLLLKKYLIYPLTLIMLLWLALILSHLLITRRLTLSLISAFLTLTDFMALTTIH